MKLRDLDTLVITPTNFLTRQTNPHKIARFLQLLQQQRKFCDIFEGPFYRQDTTEVANFCS